MNFKHIFVALSLILLNACTSQSSSPSGGVLPLSITPKAGDINLDGIVNNVDAALFLNTGKYDKCDYDCTWADGDFNGDKLVDILDAVILNTGFEETQVLVSKALPPGDMNQDGIVDNADVELFKVKALIKYDKCNYDCTLADGDFNDDKLVDILDLVILMGNQN